MNPPRKVLLVEGDAALQGLLDEWLAAEGHDVSVDRLSDERSDNQPHLVIVDLPYSREHGVELLRRVSQAHPDVPILALSSNLLASVASTGAVARALGVSGVLAKPIARAALICAVRDLTGAPA